MLQAKSSTTTFKKTNLTKGKTYYYKVRAFKKAKGKKVYGSLSDAVAIKISK